MLVVAARQMGVVSLQRRLKSEFFLHARCLCISFRLCVHFKKIQSKLTENRDTEEENILQTNVKKVMKFLAGFAFSPVRSC